MTRLAMLSLHGAFATLAIAAVARPAALWVQSEGLVHPVLAWDVPFGALALALLLAISAATIWLAVAVARDVRRGLAVHAVFLALVAACVAFRGLAAAPVRPRDPLPPLLESLRLTAEELDARYDQRYLPDASVLNAALAAAPDAGLRFRFRRLRPHARVLSGSQGPQLEPLPEDEAGTIYVAVSADRQTVWLTALSLGGVLQLPGGRPAQLEAHGGTHSLPGRDAFVPPYPGREN